MYRIVFDPNISRFVVQILVWHFFWKDCRFSNDKETPKRVTFGTYKDAAKWVSDLGLKEGYTEQNHRALYRAFSPEA